MERVCYIKRVSRIARFGKQCKVHRNLILLYFAIYDLPIITASTSTKRKINSLIPRPGATTLSSTIDVSSVLRRQVLGLHK